jgi:beta-aspartyl-dipeptidase (metallo-type)
MEKNEKGWILLSNCRLYTPDDRGLCDLLIRGGKVLYFGKHPLPLSLPGEIHSLDLSGRIVAPGFIDLHTHLIGGGGLDSPMSRMPEAFLSEFVATGTTTAIGVLGPDFLSKPPFVLFMKARQLEQEGLSTFMLTGGFRADPPQTLTGSVVQDILLVDKVVGAKISVATPITEVTYADLVKLVDEVALASRMAGKAKVVHIHAGLGADLLQPLLKLQKEGHGAKVKLQITHCNSSEQLFTQALEFARQGGYVDVTAGISPHKGSPQAIKASECIKRFIGHSIPLRQITMSTDARGISIDLAEDGTFETIRRKLARELYEEFLDLVAKENLPLSDALRVVSANGADIFGLKEKGKIQTGGDADLVVINDKLEVTDVFCRGCRMVAGGQVVAKSLFEG